jgi:predicted secreted protein
MKAIICFPFITVFLFLSCSKSSSPNEPNSDSSELNLDSTINGTTITYPSNQRFSLELDLNADVGYQWDYSISDTNVVRIDSTSYRPKSGNWNQEGGLTVENFHFHTMHYGRCDIKLIQHRVWLPNVPPIDTLRFSVLVINREEE